MFQTLPFEPFPLIKTPIQQTIMSVVCRTLYRPGSKTKLLNLSDGDQIALEITTPPHWKKGDPMVFLVHGLCGSHLSSYMVRLTVELEKRGVRVVRYNMRGCGSGRGLAKRSYHCGSSEDIFEAIKLLRKEEPDSKCLLIGFSLGGNQVLKLGGELGRSASSFLNGMIAVSPPADLRSSVLMMNDPSNKVIETFFIHRLKEEVRYLQRKFKDLKRIRFPRNMKLQQFDEIYMCPRLGYQTPWEYYQRCGAKQVIGEIAIPTRILFSGDDPIVNPNSLDDVVLPPSISLYKTKRGGHMGFLGSPRGERGFYWLDHLLVEWSQKMLI